MKELSDPERSLLFSIKAWKLPTPVREFRFAPPRRWRFDFAYPEQRMGIECEGGTWAGGRHVRGKGFEDDCEKMNQAALDGWMVFRFTTDMIDDGRAADVLRKAWSLWDGSFR